jgi:hypothetical protein
MKRINSAATAAANFIATARKYIGYQSELRNRNAFGSRVGYDSAPWSGAFIDVVAREAGLNLPSFTYTPAALAEFVRSGQISKRPRPGDIAIFNFPSTNGEGSAASAFDMPAAGIVTDVRELRTNGRFLTIEGNSTGSTAYQNKDGVHQRIRHLTDVVIFCRPAEFERPGVQRVIRLLTDVGRKLTGAAPGKLELEDLAAAATSNEAVRLNMLRAGTKNKHIELVQLALSQVTDLQGAQRGAWDVTTASAFARYQRIIGRLGSDCTGLPDVSTLQRLSKDTGLFRIE